MNVDRTAPRRAERPDRPSQPPPAPELAAGAKASAATSTDGGPPLFPATFLDRTAGASTAPRASATRDTALAALVDVRARRSVTRLGEDLPLPEAAAATALQLRSAPDSEKLALLDRLEGLGRNGHEGWLSVYDSSRVVETLSAVVKETYDPQVEQRAAGFLFKVYRDHFQDDGPHSSYLKNTATGGLVNTFGSDVLRVATRQTADPGLAETLFRRAHWLQHPLVHAAKGTPLLEEMGVSGAGQRVMVIDAAGDDHMAHTSYLAHPERSGSRLLAQGMTEYSGPKSFEQMKAALEAGRAQGANVVSISLGMAWEGADRQLYVEKAGGDGAAARRLYDRDVAELRRLMDRYPGVIVVAAGNSGAAGLANDLAKSSRVLVAGALDRSETQADGITSPAHHPKNVLGTGTTVWAPAMDGSFRFLDRATSWAAPQIAHQAACVFEAGSNFGQKISPEEVRDILLRTAEPIPGSFPRSDGVTAVRYAKTLAYLKSTGDADLLRRLRALSPQRSREVAQQVEPLLHNLGPDSLERISGLL